MITQTNFEKIVSEINSHINELEDFVVNYGGQDEKKAKSEAYQETLFAETRMEALQLALQLIEDYKDHSPGTKTPLGYLSVAEHTHPEEYAGFSIYLEDEIVATVEHENDKGLRVFTYGDMTDDEPTHIVTIKNIEEQLVTYKTE